MHRRGIPRLRLGIVDVEERRALELEPVPIAAVPRHHRLARGRAQLLDLHFQLVELLRRHRSVIRKRLLGSARHRRDHRRGAQVGQMLLGPRLGTRRHENRRGIQPALPQRLQLRLGLKLPLLDMPRAVRIPQRPRAQIAAVPVVEAPRFQIREVVIFPRLRRAVVNRVVSVRHAPRHPRLPVDEKIPVFIDPHRLDGRLRPVMRLPAKRRRQHAPRRLARDIDRARAQHPVALRIVERLQRQERHVQLRHQQIAEIIQHPDGNLRPLLRDGLRRRGHHEGFQHFPGSAPQNLQPQFLHPRQFRVRQPEIHAHELLLLRLQMERTQLQIQRHRPGRNRDA